MGSRDRSKKRSDHELKRLVEQAVVEMCDLQDSRFAFHVQSLEVRGRPPSAIKVWAVLHFMPAGSPFCCGEPECHLGLHGAAGREVSAHVQRAMGLEQDVIVDFGGRIGVEYHDGVQFIGRTNQ